MKSLKRAVICTFAIVTTMLSHAQDTTIPSPFVLLVNTNTATIYRVGWDGTEQIIPLDVPENYFSRKYAVSPDGRFLATCYLSHKGTADLTQIVIDLVTGEELIHNIYNGPVDCEGGAFNVDNSRVAFGFINYNPVFDVGFDSSQPSWDLRVYDLPTGEEVARLDAMNNPAAAVIGKADEAIMPQAISIDGDVITLTSSIRITEIVPSAHIYVWDIGKNDVTQQSDSLMSDSLPNGDKVWIDVNMELPQASPNMGFIPPYNVVMYQGHERPAGILYVATPGWLVGAEFVNGGREIIAMTNRTIADNLPDIASELFKLGRDGSVQQLETSGVPQGTLDGFLMLSTEAQDALGMSATMLTYVAGDDVTLLWQSEPTNDNFALVYTPPMNIALDLAPFPVRSVDKLDNGD